MASGISTCRKIDIYDARDELSKMQSEYGDSLIGDVLLPRVMQTEFQRHTWPRLIDLWARLSLKLGPEFLKKYGHIGSLINVVTPVALLQAAIHYWDPAYRCFTFGRIDLSPTIEEYAQLLQLEPHNSKMYYFHENMTAEKIVARILEREIEDVRKRGSLKGGKWCFPIDELTKFFEERPNTASGQSALALAIYGAVLFPCTRGYVEGRVIKLFNQVDRGVNPVPAIICETIRSLNFCRSNKKAKFIGCSALLGIWLVSHLQYYKHFNIPRIGFKDHTRPEKRPIWEFTETKWKQGYPSIEEWEEFLQSLDVHNIEGRAPWFLPDAFLYQCGDFLWVPLLGPWGAVSQAPALVFRQMGSNPCIPATYGLLDFEFYYDEGEDPELIIPKVRNVLKAWKSLKTTNRGKRTSDGTLVYFKWHEKRGKTMSENSIQERYVCTSRANTVEESSTRTQNGQRRKRPSTGEDEELAVRKIENLKRTVHKAIQEAASHKRRCELMEEEVSRIRSQEEEEMKELERVSIERMHLEQDNQQLHFELQKANAGRLQALEEVKAWKLQHQNVEHKNITMEAAIRRNSEEVSRLRAAHQTLLKRSQIEVAELSDQNEALLQGLIENREARAKLTRLIGIAMCQVTKLSAWAVSFEKVAASLSKTETLQKPEFEKVLQFLNNLRSDLVIIGELQYGGFPI